MRELKANTEVKVVIGPFVDVADGYTPETGVAISTADEAELMKHNASTVTDISANTWAAIASMDGYYNLTLSESNLDTEGMIVIAIQDDSVCLPVRAEFMVMSEAAYDSKYAPKDTGYMDVNIKAIGDSTTVVANVEADYDGTGYAKSNSTIGLINDAITSAKYDESTAFPLVFADSGATKVARTGADSDTLETISDEIAALNNPTAASIADAVLDEAISGHAIAGSLGKAVADIDAGVNNLETRVTSARAGYLDNLNIGENVAGTSEISGLNDPSAADIADAVWDEAQADHVTAGSTGESLSSAGSGASAADIADAVWDELLSGHEIDGSAGKFLSNTGSGASAADIADAVWDEQQSGHISAGSMGAAIAALPSDADVQVACAAAINAYDPPTKAEVDTATALTTSNIKDTLLNKSVSTRHDNDKPKQYTAGTGGNQATVNTTIDSDGNIETEVKV